MRHAPSRTYVHTSPGAVSRIPRSWDSRPNPRTSPNPNPSVLPHPPQHQHFRAAPLSNCTASRPAAIHPFPGPRARPLFISRTLPPANWHARTPPSQWVRPRYVRTRKTVFDEWRTGRIGQDRTGQYVCSRLTITPACLVLMQPNSDSLSVLNTDVAGRSPPAHRGLWNLRVRIRVLEDSEYSVLSTEWAAWVRSPAYVVTRPRAAVRIPCGALII
ncbi:hypothetical protein OH77DRAFT_774008 [Trametes cingulata]|nr:hypothetical protein OH77DRAFT_774008 [Trametes cingulata]